MNITKFAEILQAAVCDSAMTSKESQEPKEAAGVVKSPKGRSGGEKTNKGPPMLRGMV